MSDLATLGPPAASTQVVDGRYRLLRLIGIGGMGAVYEAEHVAIGRRVAVKILHPQFSQHPDLVERLRREAQAASQIGHPNIVDVTDFGRTEDGSAYLAMEFLHGTDLGAILREHGYLDEGRALRIGLQTVRALAAAHCVGIVHRDLKPENIFLVSPLNWSREPGRDSGSSFSTLAAARSDGARSSDPGSYDLVKVLDFGIAMQLHSEPLIETTATIELRPALTAARLTNPGLTIGTPEYMAPEQATAQSVDARADIYSVGTLLFEMVCGRVPFVAPTTPELLTMKTGQPAPSPRTFAPAIVPALETLILACLERDPAARPQTMEAVEQSLLSIAIATGAIAPPAPLGSALSPMAMGSGELSTSASQRMPALTSRLTGVRAAMVLGAATALVIIGFASARYVVRRAPPLGPVAVTAPPPAASSLPVRAQPEPPAPRLLPEPVRPVLAPEEVQMLLEWARRAAAAGRYTAPPGDNLKELLDRIEAKSPSSSEARALREATTRQLAKRLRDQLKRRRPLEALASYQALRMLEPSHPLHGLRRALLVQLLSLARRHRRDHDASLLAAKGAVEIAPHNAAAYEALSQAQPGRDKKLAHRANSASAGPQQR